MSDPLIFDIARGSFSDGPGVRTVVFFKGCPLRCVWCHNPESQHRGQETLFFPKQCIRCGNCDRGLKCHSRARRLVGRHYSPDYLVDTILQDKPYYDTSGGGVTFSGGEPLLFVTYLSKVLSRLKRLRIHVAVQTSGHFDFKRFNDEIAPHVDLIYYDLKIFDAAAHALHTGKPNDIIKENLPRLLETDIEVILRIPLVPKYTATKENLSQFAGYLAGLGVEKVALVYYNPAAGEKRKHLGYALPPNYVEDTLSIDEQKQWIRYFEDRFDLEHSRRRGTPTDGRRVANFDAT